MREYVDNGVRLGWLIDPQDEAGGDLPPWRVEVLQSPTTLSGEDDVVMC